VGLKGSKDIANYYKQNNIPVAGVYHVEMSGYVAPGNEKQITILEDYVSRPLTNFLKVSVDLELPLTFFFFCG